MADENPDPENPPEPEPESEALRLRTLAEEKYVAGNLKSALKYAKRAHRLHPSLGALPEIITAFKILRTSTKSITSVSTDNAVSATPAPPDYYKILQIERFAHINTIKKQYKKLALTIHPDKNPFVASEEAFKHVGEAFRVLSDRIRRKEYDMRLRIAMQNEAEALIAGVGVEELDTFWTACSTCRLLHKFERKYLGHNLVCPSCKKSFKAVEVEENDGSERVEEEKEDNPGRETVDEREDVGVRTSERIKARKLGKMSNVGEVLERSRGKNEGLKVEKESGSVGKKRGLESSGGGGVIEGLRLRSGGKKEKIGGVEVLERTRVKRVKVVEEENMTLAEMQILVKKKVGEEKLKSKGKEKDKDKEDREKEMEKEKVKEKEKEAEGEIDVEKLNEKEREEEEEEEENEKLNDNGKKTEKDRETEKEMLNKKERKLALRKVKEREKRERQGVSDDENMAIVGRRVSRSSRDLGIEKQKSRQNNLEFDAVEDSDFYDFDKDRAERNFKKGQVWAVYDNEDGMPRNYALINEVRSVNPLHVRLSWLEFESNGDEQLISWEKMGFHSSCGRFRVSKNTSVKSLKLFSHLADCQKAARELFRIYPKKGSVWALYNENALDSEGSNQKRKDKGCYDIVVFLTSYSDKHGSSMAYLEKVVGFKRIFKRREIGAHAIRWLEKEDFRLFSHQIPGRKLSGEEAPGLPKDCWGLDAASLPPDLLTIGWGDKIEG